MFHRKCLIERVESGNSQRNACPSCRKKVYQCVPLTNEQIQDMAHDRLGDALYMPEKMILEFELEFSAGIMDETDEGED